MFTKKTYKHHISSTVEFLSLIIFFITFGEVFLYSGFFFKHPIYLIVIILSILLTLMIFYRKIRRTKLVKDIFIISVVTLSILYIVTNILEKMTYHNYVYSHLHIHPELILLPLFFLIIAFSAINYKKGHKILLYILIFLAIGQYSINVFKSVKNSRPLYILRNINMSYDKKMGNMMGALFYDYARFIKDNTPERSTILIPPQGFPWPQTGNIGYLRYLLYPRTLINGGEKESKVDIKDVDYVLVDYGESSISEYGFTNVWPKFDVSGDYIIYWDPKTGETIKDNAGIYKYKVNDKSERWGIIKIIK